MTIYEGFKNSKIHVNRNRFIIECNKIIKQLQKRTEIVLDPKRQVNNADKESIWNESKNIKHFDYNIFKKDILGNVVIKNIQYNNNKFNKEFAAEFEHFVAYSDGGESSKDNVCLLNAGINRSKKQKGIYHLNYYEKDGLNANFGVSPKQLLTELNYDLHNTCKEYNLHFTMKNNYWTILKNNKNYKKYNDEYKNFPKNIKIENERALLLALSACGIIYGCVNYPIKAVYKEYVKPIVNKGDDDKEKEMTMMDHIITHSCTVLTIAGAVMMAFATMTPKEEYYQEE